MDAVEVVERGDPPPQTPELVLGGGELLPQLDVLEVGLPERLVHNWERYRPKDPTAADRAQRYRDRKRDDHRDDHRDADRDDQRDASRARGFSRPGPSRDLSKAAAGSTPAIDDPGRVAAAELRELAEALDDLDIGGPLRQQAMAEPTRALACARKAERSAKGNPAGYFRRLLESGDAPTENSSRPEERRPNADAYQPFSDPPPNGKLTPDPAALELARSWLVPEDAGPPDHDWSSE